MYTVKPCIFIETLCKKKSIFTCYICDKKHMSRINFFNEKENENDNDNDNENDQCLHRLNKIYFKAHK